MRPPPKPLPQPSGWRAPCAAFPAIPTADRSPRRCPPPPARAGGGGHRRGLRSAVGMAGNAAQGARHPEGCGSGFGGGRMIVMLDNYDSFTYNLVQYLGELGARVKVFRNDEVAVQEIESLSPSHIVISPGPCTPNEAGITLELIRRMAGRVPILGVCLG